MLFGLALLSSAALGHLSFEEFHELYKDLRTGQSLLKTLEQRKETYAQNIKYIEEHNAKGLSWKMGVNHFADLTKEEWADEIGLPMCAETMKKSLEAHRERTKHHLEPIRNPKNAASVDWRDEGAVTTVKNQGSCGSCWAFSTTGSVEGAWKNAGNTLVSLSEQQLVSCDRQWDNGCNGGLMDYGFDYIKSNSGINSEAAYPYTSGGGTRGDCNSDLAAVHVAKVSGYTDVTPNSATAMENALNAGPVSVAVEADKNAWQFYQSGVLNDNGAYGACGSNLDHGVLAVGYGTDNGSDYWIVKNSWGGTWGESGYIRLAKGALAPSSGECGVLKQPSFPTI